MISVIIPLYNKEAIVAHSIQSVLSQDYDDFELVVVNDGSTDSSVAVVEQIKDNRIRMIHQKNGGPSKARNTGAKHTKGDWILFLDADDELLPGALKRFATLTKEKENADIIVCPYLLNNGKDLVLSHKFERGWIKNNFKAQFYNQLFLRTGSFVCKSPMIYNHPFNEALWRYEDFEVWFQLYRKAKIYINTEPSMVLNEQYASASNSRTDIKEDFIGHLDFKGKSFWEKMCLYKLYLWERDYYSKECDKLYPLLRWRYDLLLLYKILHFLKKHHVL